MEHDSPLHKQLPVFGGLDGKCGLALTVKTSTQANFRIAQIQGKHMSDSRDDVERVEAPSQHCAGLR
jgi:hypothetical protein